MYNDIEETIPNQLKTRRFDRGHRIALALAQEFENVIDIFAETPISDIAAPGR